MLAFTRKTFLRKLTALNAQTTLLQKVKYDRSAFSKVEVTFSPEQKIQFFVPVNSSISDFAAKIQKHLGHKIDYDIDNSLHPSGNQNFIDTAVFNNLRLRIDDKILAFQVKGYEEEYPLMNKYNADLLEQFQKQTPTDIKVKDVLDKPLELVPPENPKEHLRSLQKAKTDFFSWYNTEMEKIAQKCMTTPKLIVGAMVAQWIGLFGITYGIYGWDTGEPLAYLSALSVDLALFIGYLGTQERYEKKYEEEKAKFLSVRVSDAKTHYKMLHWRTAYLSKKVDSL